MKKFYKIVLLLTTLLLLTTYNPSGLNIFPKKKFIFFNIQNIEVENNYIINEHEVLEKLENIFGKNIFFVKKFDLATPLKTIDFLKKIEVKKKYPNTIIIKIFETKPIAILFKNNEKYLLDSSSNLIIFNKNEFTSDFPTIFGEGAEENFVNFSKQIESNNFPKQRVKNYYYFQIGRWDLQLLNGQIIKFPNNKTVEAIKQAVELLKKKDFKSYNIIDLRMHGKIVVE